MTKYINPEIEIVKGLSSIICTSPIDTKSDGTVDGITTDSQEETV